MKQDYALFNAAQKLVERNHEKLLLFSFKLANTRYIGKGSKEIQGDSPPGIAEQSAHISRVCC